jgi:hypothetical protein
LEDAERFTVITGGGPNRPRVILDATGGWVYRPGGTHGWGPGLVPACLRIKSVKIMPITAAEAVGQAAERARTAQAGLRATMATRLIAETGSDPATARLVQSAGHTAGGGLVGRPYAIVNGGRDPIQHLVDAAGAQMVGAQWLVSKTDALLPHRQLTDEDVERGWPYLEGNIVVDLKKLDATGDGALDASDVLQALASTERLIRPGTADEALLMTDPVEAVSAALMLALIDMDRHSTSAGWNAPLDHKRLRF